jgi:hypothetical protein
MYTHYLLCHMQIRLYRLIELFTTHLEYNLKV